MTLELSDEVLAHVDAYRTCELATVTRSGTPLAWPTCPLYDPSSGTFTITTSIALPTKAVNVRREPRVALLFSDPTGSGSDTRPQVLVQGTAACPDVVLASPAGLERYWARLYARQPGGTAYGRSALSRRLMDWYYFRLVLTVTPQHVEVRPPLPPGGPLPGVRTRGDDPAARTGRQLRHYRSAVLSWCEADGAPTCLRVRPEPAPGGTLLLPQAAELREGPAGLLCHSHDEQLWSQRSFASTGRLTGGASGWTFTPERYVPGAGPDPRQLVRLVRSARATSRRYLDSRGLDRPQVDWAGFRALYDRPDLAA